MTASETTHRTPLGVHYTVQGSGPALLLIHGVCHSHEAWGRVIPFLTRYFTVYALDLPGHGRSVDIPSDPQQVRSLILDATLELLGIIQEENGGTPPFIAGNSLGGYIALEVAQQHPLTTSGVVAFSPAGFFHGKADQTRTIVQFKALRAIGRILRPVIPLLARNAVGRTMVMGMFSGMPWKIPPEEIVRDSDGLLSNTLIDMATEVGMDFTPAPRDNPALPPMHCLWGTRDLTLIRGWTMHQKVLPQATLQLLPGLGHVPMYDDPALVAYEIRAALGR